MQTRKARSRWSRTGKLMKENIGLYGLILLPLAYVIIFQYLPMYGIVIAFKNFKPAKGILGSSWVGLYHFQRFINTARFTRILKNTIFLSLYSLFAEFPIPVLLAVLLNSCTNKPLKKVTQTVTYAPHFISTVVFVGMLNVFFAPSTGIVKQIMTKIGLMNAADNLGVLTSEAAFKHLYVWSGVWQGMGWGSIIYLAALSGVDPTLHEAARVDGANKIQRIWHIDIPAIVPTIVTMFILRCGSILGVGFEKVYLMQNSLNGNAAEVISTYVYKVGLLDAQYSYSAAIGLANNIVNLIMLLTVDRIAKSLGQNGLF
jgi:putative aldouronate transport system permease protein